MTVRPTPKAVAAGIVALVLLVLAGLGVGGPPVVLGAALVPAIIAAANAEARRAAREIYRFTAERRHPARAGEGSAVRVEIRIQYHGDSPPSYIEVEDHPDRRLRARGKRMRTLIAPRGEATVSYTLTPAPGLGRIRGLTLRSGDPIGLFVAERTVELRTTLAVTPSWLPVRETAGGRLRGLEEALVSRVKGASPEFYQLREYQPGDDVRLVHWPSSARAGRLMVREGTMTVRSNIGILVDLSAPTWPGTPGMAPADWIMRTALYLVRQAARNGGTIWVYILRGEYWEEWPLLRGRDAYHAVASRLSQHGPDTAERRLGLETALESMARGVPKGTRLVALLGPALSLRSVAHTLATTLAEGACWEAVGVFLPTGPSRAEEAVRRAEAAVYRRVSRELQGLPVPVRLLATPGEVAWFAVEASVGGFRGC